MGNWFKMNIIQQIINIPNTHLLDLGLLMHWSGIPTEATWEGRNVPSWAVGTVFESNPFRRTLSVFEILFFFKGYITEADTCNTSEILQWRKESAQKCGELKWIVPWKWVTGKTERGTPLLLQ